MLPCFAICPITFIIPGTLARHLAYLGIWYAWTSIYRDARTDKGKDIGFVRHHLQCVCQAWYNMQLCNRGRSIRLHHFHNTFSCNTVGHCATIPPFASISSCLSIRYVQFFPVHSVMLLCQFFSDPSLTSALLHIYLQDILFGPWIHVCVCLLTCPLELSASILYDLQ